MVVVAVGGRHPAEQILRPSLGLPGIRRRQHGDDLDLGVEGDARDLLLDQERVVDAVARALPARPGPATHRQSEGDARPQCDSLPGLPGLPPLVALEGGEAREGDDGHHHAVGAVVADLAGVGGVARLLQGPLVRPHLVGLGPVGTERAQQHARHDALVPRERGERSEDGEEWVGAGVEQVVVAEDAQRHVLGAARPERDRPCLLALLETQRVFLRSEFVDAGLRVVRGDLAADDALVVAARHEGHAVGVGGQLQREGLRHGDRAEQVLDGKQRALA